MPTKTGIKIEEYNFISKEAKKEYERKFNKIFVEMMGEWIKSGKYKDFGKEYKDLKEETAEKKLIKLLDLIEKGQAEKDKYIEEENKITNIKIEIKKAKEALKEAEKKLRLAEEEVPKLKLAEERTKQRKIIVGKREATQRAEKELRKAEKKL